MGSKWGIIMGIVVVGLGTAWLLDALNALPNIDWLLTISLFLVGALVLMFGGINRLSLIVGPFFLVAGLTSLARQMGILHRELEMPVLVISLGALLLIMNLLPVPPLSVDEDEKKGYPKSKD